jgi:glutaminyl-tRNA synthetase
MSTPEHHVSGNFIHDIIDKDNASGKYGQRVHTRFPPEPNGYLHIGHAKSICLNFGTALKYGGKCNLRFDDTNPSKEEVEYVDSIQADVKWLGFDWEDRLFYASDYFGKLYDYAEELIKAGHAYVCDLSADEIRRYRGTLTEPGKNSPYRDRGVAENLDLFRRMKAGEFPDGSRVLRAKIDMASPNLNMRDPVLYRIMRANHHRTGDKWCIYPMYDYAHPLSDAWEGITHSICTLEFEAHRPLYDWCLDVLGAFNPRPVQIEFARLNLTYTVMSKRKLRALVESGRVAGWDDPRMPTISGLRRRGYTPEAIRDFCSRIGVAKADSVVDYALLEHCVREDLGPKAARVMTVLRPLKARHHQLSRGQNRGPYRRKQPRERGHGYADHTLQSRTLHRTGRLHGKPAAKILPPHSRRRSPPQERLYHQMRRSRQGRRRQHHRTPLHLRPRDQERLRQPAQSQGHDPLGIRGGLRRPLPGPPLRPPLSPRRPRIRRRKLPRPRQPDSLVTLTAMAEPVLAAAKAGDRFQFIRHGYFYADPDSTPGKPVFNRIVGLKDSWAKLRK